MLNEERIRLMTKMAAYEENEGKTTIPISNYFRGDYISFQVVKGAISATIAFALVVAMYVYYDIEIFLEDIYKMDIASLMKTVLTAYAAILIGYMLISYIVYSYRYTKAKKSLHRYFIQLRELHAMYEREGRR
ncbi:MAG TPA: hypothetical protein VJZ01_12335 [Lachnospiraceae bacterium]|jgi:hypothetical protein|nr:hypothetical protein [Lachnospiraceae bacterium]